MTTTFEQARALYDSDEQMARTLLDLVIVTRLDLELQQALRRRAEDKLQLYRTLKRKPQDGAST
jgi:predicted outer membrane protein